MSDAASVEEEEVVKFDFDISFQNKIIALMLRDARFAYEAHSIVKPEYFVEDASASLVKLLVEHIKSHRAPPDIPVLVSILKDAVTKKRVRSDMVPEIRALIKGALTMSLSNGSYVKEKIVDFARHRAVEEAILQSVALLDKGDFNAIEKITKKALGVGAEAKTDEYDYFKEISSRSKVREDFKAGKIIKRGITTGYSSIDAYLYHGGWGRKELSLLMGAAKAGKSMSMGEFTKNASLFGYQTAYISCEVSKEIIADRLDANIADTMMRSLADDWQNVEQKIKLAETKAGALKIFDFASGTLKPSRIARMVEDYRAEGLLLDLLTVDYADIMASEYRSDREIDNLRSIYIDLRALAHEYDIALLTATQTNRSGATAATSSMTDVADDFNKIRTADVVIAINATPAERSSGEARLTWVASRNTEDGFSMSIKQDREKLKFITKVLGRV